jgi:hypothetical protein
MFLPKECKITQEDKEYPISKYTLSNLEHKIAGFSLPGKKKNKIKMNEDSLFIFPTNDGYAALIFDGIGGNPDKITMHSSIDVVSRFLIGHPDLLIEPKELLIACNDQIAERCQGYGISTVTLALIPENKNQPVNIIYAGDSPIYSGNHFLKIEPAITRHNETMPDSQGKLRVYLNHALGFYGEEFETREISHPSLMIGGSDGIDEIFNYAHHIFRYHKKINSEEVNANEGNLEDIKSLDVNSDNINSQKNCKGIKEISYDEISTEEGIRIFFNEYQRILGHDKSVKPFHAVDFCDFVLDKSLPYLSKWQRHDDITLCVYGGVE